MTTLGDEFPKEIERTREKLKLYEELPPQSGWFAVGMIKDVIARAEKAWAEQDTIAMISLYQEMQGIKL